MKKSLSYLLLVAVTAILFMSCHVCKQGVCAPCKCSICKKHIPAPGGACSDGSYIFTRADMEEIIEDGGLLLYKLDNGDFAMVKDNSGRTGTQPSHIRTPGTGCPLACDVAVADRNTPISAIDGRLSSVNNPGMHNRVHLERSVLQPLIDQGVQYIAVFVPEDPTKEVAVMGFNSGNVTTLPANVRAHRATVTED